MTPRQAIALILSLLLALPAAAWGGGCIERPQASGGRVECCGPQCQCGPECGCRASAPALPEAPTPAAPASSCERLALSEGGEPVEGMAVAPRAAARSSPLRRRPASRGREVLLRKRVLRT